MSHRAKENTVGSKVQDCQLVLLVTDEVSIVWICLSISEKDYYLYDITGFGRSRPKVLT